MIDWAFQPFRSIYAQYRVNRSDNTLPLCLFKNLKARLQHIKERTRNVFGAQALTLELQNGRMNDEPKKRKWFRMPKKIYSRRYSTDCQQAIFERRTENNFVGIDDFREYADDMANGEKLDNFIWKINLKILLLIFSASSERRSFICCSKWNLSHNV